MFSKFPSDDLMKWYLYPNTSIGQTELNQPPFHFFFKAEESVPLLTMLLLLSQFIMNLIRELVYKELSYSCLKAITVTYQSQNLGVFLVHFILLKDYEKFWIE